MAVVKRIKMDSKSEKRLVIQINSTLHKDLKHRAIEKGIPLKQWVLEAVNEKIKQERAA
jgi:predicted HicB family RNase H-like nuclease